MSIIYDALKKTQETINTAPRIQTDTKDRHSKSNPKPYLVYALVTCLVFFIGNMIFSFLINSKTASKETVETLPLPIAKELDVAPPAIVQKAEEIQPKPQEAYLISGYKKDPKESLVLNGIFFSQDQGYALINNHIVKVGDVIEDATVKQITQDEVELEASGTTFKLSTRIR